MTQPQSQQTDRPLRLPLTDPQSFLGRRMRNPYGIIFTPQSIGGDTLYVVCHSIQNRTEEWDYDAFIVGLRSRFYTFVE